MLKWKGESMLNKVDFLKIVYEPVSKYPEVYNSVSNFLYRKFKVSSAEISLLVTYTVIQYIKCILSKSIEIESWDLKYEDIIYKEDILKLFHMKGESDGKEA